mgnify:CR=1 FL=1
MAKKYYGEIEISKYDARHKALVLPVVRIDAGNATGSGTVIYSDKNAEDEFTTLVLTNEHVVDGLIKVEERWDALLKRPIKKDILGIPVVEFFEYRWESRAVGSRGVQSEIVAYDKEEDLALLKLSSGKPADAVATLYPRGQEHKIRVTMPVYCIGAGAGDPPVTTEGILSQFGRIIENREFWQATAPSFFGNSGGALFLAETYEFIGVPARLLVQGGLYGSQAITHMGYSIPITRVYNFLEHHRFRFVYDAKFTEVGEAKERERLRQQEKERMGRDDSEKTEHPHQTGDASDGVTDDGANA